MSVDRRRAAGTRRRAQLRLEKESSPEQADISAYFAAIMFFFALLLATDFYAVHKLAAFGFAAQIGAALLLSPELLRPFRRFHYFERSLPEIRASRRRLTRLAVIALAVLVLLVAVRIVDDWGVVSLSALPDLGVLISIYACLLIFCFLIGLWQIEMLFEGAAEGWIQSAVKRFGADSTTETRRAVALVVFLIGALLSLAAYF